MSVSSASSPKLSTPKRRTAKRPTTTLARGAAAVGVLAVAAACSNDTSTAPSAASALSASLLATAFSTSTPGYNYLSSSYNASSGSTGSPTGSSDSTTGTFGPGGHGGHGDHGFGGGHEPGFGDLMAGGLGGGFMGDGGFGPGFGRGLFGVPFGGNLPLGTCTFSSATGVITCAPVTANGLTVTRTAKYTNAAGAAQQAFDTTTDAAVTHVEVSGTTAFTPRSHHGFGPGFGRDSSNVTVASATSTVSSTSDRSVTGLASGSASRTVSGTSAGQESTSGTLSDSSTFTSTRVMGDTTTGLVVPVKTGSGVYPTAGTVIRASKASVTIAGGAPKTTTRREVVTYDGSATAKVTIVQNDTTRNCTLPLPRGRLSCS